MERVYALCAPQTAITVWVDQSPKECQKPANTAFVGVETDLLRQFVPSAVFLIAQTNGNVTLGEQYFHP